MAQLNIVILPGAVCQELLVGQGTLRIGSLGGIAQMLAVEQMARMPVSIGIPLDAARVDHVHLAVHENGDGSIGVSLNKLAEDRLMAEMKRILDQEVGL